MNSPFLDVAEGGYPAGRLSTSSLITESGGERSVRFTPADGEGLGGLEPACIVACTVVASHADALAFLAGCVEARGRALLLFSIRLNHVVLPEGPE